MKTDEDLEEVTRDIEEDHEALRQMSIRLTTKQSSFKETNVLRMKQEVDVVFHKMEIFQEMFAEYFLEQLENF